MLINPSKRRRSPASCVVCWTLFLLFLPVSLYAGSITLTIDNQNSVTGSQLAAEFRLRNSGTETAWNISLMARFLEHAAQFAEGASIPPEQMLTIPFAFTLPADRQGTFPLFAQVVYHDAGGNKTSAPVLGFVRTDSAPDAALALRLLGLPERGKPLRVELAATDRLPHDVTLTCHAADDISVTPPTQRVNLRNGAAEVVWQVVNRTAKADEQTTLFVVAEYDEQGVHYTAHTIVTVPVNALAPARMPQFRRAGFILIGLLLIAFGVGFILYARRQPRLAFRAITPRRWLFDLLALLVIEAVIIVNVSPRSLLMETITTGGDTASHYYTAEYLRHVLLPQGSVSGWTPGNYAGFPILQMYFPLPFLLMCALDVVMPLQIAFKFASLAGTLLLPIAIYVMLRYLRTPFPGPAIGAGFALPFLFNTANAMWGGNLLSTLAGEFSYSLSLSLTLILLGSLYDGCLQDRHVVRSALLVFLVGFSHGYTLLFAEAVSLCLLLTPHGFFKRLWHLFRVYALGGLLLAFWLLPLLAYNHTTTPYHNAWQIYSWQEVLPKILWPVVALAAIGSIGLFIPLLGGVRGGLLTTDNLSTPPTHPQPLPGGEFTASSHETHVWARSGRASSNVLSGRTEVGNFPLSSVGLLWFGVGIATAMFVAAPRLGVVDIRYVPCGQLMLALIAAMGLGWLGASARREWLAALLLTLTIGATVAWSAQFVSYIPAWAKWNYDGFETKSAWPILHRLTSALKGTFQDPRVVFEQASSNNDFGSSRVFESLPLFSGRATLEGLYMQASPSSPFVFYLQSEISQENSCPFRQYYCTYPDFERARRHLELFNVRELILRSALMKEAIRKHPAYRLLAAFGEHELWELTGQSGRYVAPLASEPVLFTGTDWKTAAYQWFLRPELADRTLVFQPHPSAADLQRFPAQTASLDALPPSTPLQNACQIKETIRNEEILIETDCLNQPLLVKMSHHPNWRVTGADQVYLASPAFMLIYPTQTHVRLYYGAGWPDRVGGALTVFGLLCLAAALPILRGQSLWTTLAPRLTIPTIWRWQPSDRRRSAFVCLAFLLSVAVMTVSSYAIYANDPNRWFNQGIHLKDTGRFEEARQQFRRVMQASSPVAGLAADAAYYTAICFYSEAKDAEAITAFQALLTQYPGVNRTPEAMYHIGLIYLRMGQEETGNAALREVLTRYPQTIWAGYAKERLKEHQAL